MGYIKGLNAVSRKETKKNLWVFCALMCFRFIWENTPNPI